MGNTFNTGRLINGLFVDASGNVGIGTTTPAEKLSVIGNIRIDNGAADGGQLVLASSGFSDWNLDNFSGRFRAYYGATEYFTILANGSVGIGTTSPTLGKLQVQGSGGDTLLNVNNTTTNASGLYLSVYTSGSLVSSGRILQDNSGNMRFNTGTSSDTERMRITSGGQIGIGITPTGSWGLQMYGNGTASSVARIQLQNSSTGSADGDGGGISMEGIDFVTRNNESGVVKWELGGTERMRISAGGNIGIGTTTGTSFFKLNIDGHAVHTTSSYATDGANDPYRAGVGWQSAANPGVVLSSLFTTINDGNYGGHFVWLSRGTNGGNMVEKMRITSIGDLLIGKNALGWTVPGLQTEANGTNLGITNPNSSNNLFIRKNDATGTMIQFWYNNSSVGSVSISTSSTSYNTSSDYRLKEDLKQINGLQKVSEIKVYDFQWKSDKTRMDGVLAHELAEVLPYAVYGEKDGEEMQGVDYSKIVPVLVKAIQEQQEIINNLSAKVTALENK